MSDSPLFLIKKLSSKKAIPFYLYGLINGKGEIVTEPIFRNINYYFEGYAGVKKLTNHDTSQEFREKWGFIDAKGVMVIEPKFHLVRNFCDGLAPVCNGGDYFVEGIVIS